MMKRLLAPAAALGLLLIAWQVHAGIGHFLFQGACITNCGGGGGGGGGAVVATNDFYMPATGGTPPGSVVPYSFGQAFRSGDVPAGNSVSVTDNQGHPLTYQIDSISPAWPDGSWRHVVITAFVPATAGNVQQRLKLVLNPQAYAPASTPRSIAEISAHNYLIKYDNVKTHPAGTFCGSVGCNPNGYTWSTKGSHSGNFTCNIDNFIAAGQYKIRKNGPVVLEALVYGQATDDGGGTDPHLYCRDWIDVYSDPTNPNGTGAGHILYTEHMPLLQQPIADPADGSTLPGTGGNDANADFVIGQASYYDGSTKIRDFADDTINLTSSAIVPANGRSGYITTSLPHMQARSGYMVQAVSGTLPTGLSNGLIGFAWAPFGAQNFTLRPDIYTNNDNYYNVTDSGSNAVFKLVPLQYMAYYNGFFITQASDTNDGLAVPLQQAGTWAPPAEWMVQPNLDGTTHDNSTASQKAYWQSTGLIPGWDISLGASVQSLNSNEQWNIDFGPWYNAGSNGPYRTGINSGAGSLDTDGPWQEWASNWFMRLGATNWNPSDLLIEWNAELFTSELPNTQMERLPGTGGTTAGDEPRIIPWDNGSGDPAALGTAAPNDVWYADNCSFSNGSCVNNAFVFPANTLPGVLPQWYYGSYSSHFTNYHWPPSGIIGYLMFGRDYINYLERGTAQRALLQEAGYQNINIGGTNYQRVTQICSPNGEIITLPFAAGLLGPASDPEITYFRNYINRQNAMVTAFYNAEDASKHAAGACLSQGNAEGFNTSYTYLGYAWSFAASRLNGIDLMMRDWATWLAGQSDVPGSPATANGVGTWGVAASVVGAGYYNSIIGGWSMNTTGIAPNPTKYHGSNAVGLGGSDAISVATNGVFSYGGNWVALGNLNNGDELIAAADGAGTYSGPPELGPPNFPELTTFYLINVNQTAQTFQLTSNCTTFTGTTCTTPDPAHIISTFSQAWGGCDNCWWNLRPKHDTGGTTSDAAFTYTLLPKASMAEFIRDGIPTNPTYNPNLTQAFNVLNARLPSSSVSSITGSPFYSRISQVTTVPIVPTPPQSVTSSDPTAGLLPPERDAYGNWKMAGLQSLGGIPNRTTQCGSTLTPLGGGADDTSQIQTAINNCPSGQFVKLAAGTFTIAEPSHLHVGSGITVRGAGPQQTILTRPTGSPPPGTSSTCPPPAGAGATWNCSSGGASTTEMFDIGFDRFVGNTETACALTSDAAAASYTVNVTPSCLSLFHAGDIVLLDELTGAQNMPDPEIPASNGIYLWAAPDYRVVYHVHNPGQGGDDSLSQVDSSYTLNTDRMTNELKQVASVNASNNTVTFDSPVMISYRVSHTADLWHFATPFVQQAGIEGMTLQYPDNGAVFIQYCAYCWTKRVEVEYFIGQGIHLNTSFRAQVDQLYIHECVWPVPGEACYNIDSKYDSTESLIQNSISVIANKVITMRGSGSGSVVAYNYLDKGYIRDSCCWQEIGANASHLTGPHHVLFEGNWTFNMDSDATHGGSDYITYFRNWSTAIRSSFLGMDTTGTINDAANTCGTTAYSGSPLRAAGAQAYSYWFSFIGNYLGTPGCTTQANGFPLNGVWNGPQNSDGIFLIGWWNGAQPPNTDANDPQSATIYPATPPTINGPSGSTGSCTSSGTNCATIVDGNYNTYNSAQQWATNDTAHTLPNSFFLSGSPSFFAGNTWPWVNPAAGTTATLPAKAAYDNAGCATATFQNNAQCTPFP